MTDEVTVPVFLAVCSVPYFAPCCILPTTYCLRLSAGTESPQVEDPALRERSRDRAKREWRSRDFRDGAELRQSSGATDPNGTEMAKLCLGRGDTVTKWRSDRGTRRRLEDEEKGRTAERGGRR